jgi:hypothetical protein
MHQLIANAAYTSDCWHEPSVMVRASSCGAGHSYCCYVTSVVCMVGLSAYCLMAHLSLCVSRAFVLPYLQRLRALVVTQQLWLQEPHVVVEACNLRLLLCCIAIESSNGKQQHLTSNAHKEVAILTVRLAATPDEVFTQNGSRSVATVVANNVWHADI